MFSPAPTARQTASRRSLRARLVRGLDVAVELVTLGEYGVEEVPAGNGRPGRAGEADAWTWPPRGAAAGPELRLPRLRPPRAACSGVAGRAGARTRAGAVDAPAPTCHGR